MAETQIPKKRKTTPEEQHIAWLEKRLTNCVYNEYYSRYGEMCIRAQIGVGVELKIQMLQDPPAEVYRAYHPLDQPVWILKAKMQAMEIFPSVKLYLDAGCVRQLRDDETLDRLGITAENNTLYFRMYNKD
jgi:hypothetical protein